MKYCYLCWFEEWKYFEMEWDDVVNFGILYFNDVWNYFDWVMYVWIFGIIVMCIFVVLFNSEIVEFLYFWVFVIVLIFIWLWLMKVFCGFEMLGFFIVMIGYIIDDMLKFGFFYFEIYVFYVCVFWIVFGGSKNVVIMES